MLWILLFFIFSLLFGWLAFTTAGAKLGLAADAAFLLCVGAFLTALVRALSQALFEHVREAATENPDRSRET
jgi:hypothetical protein